MPILPHHPNRAHPLTDPSPPLFDRPTARPPDSPLTPPAILTLDTGDEQDEYVGDAITRDGGPPTESPPRSRPAERPL